MCVLLQSLINEAMWNMLAMSVTASVLQSLIGWLKDDILQNMPFMFVTASVPTSAWSSWSSQSWSAP